MLCAAIYVLLKKNKETSLQFSPVIEVVIPVRNESPKVLFQLEKRVSNILQQHDCVVSLVDDGSSTPLEVRISSFNVKIHRIESGSKGSKKNALTKAIEASKAEWIVTSDADTLHRKNWLNRLSKFMKPHAEMICAPVFMSSNSGFISKFSQCESVCLWSVALAGYFFRVPLLCSGANLAFRRDAWLSVGGYTSHAHIASGDDVLLMHQFWKRDSNSVLFCVHPDAACFTHAPQSWEEWFSQRRRWISKTEHVQDPRKMLFLFFVAIWLYLPFFLLYFSLSLAAVLFLIETLWVFFLARYYKLKLPRSSWFFFRLGYPLILPIVFFIQPGVWKAQGKT